MMARTKIWGKLGGFEKYLGLCESFLETLDEKHWLGKGVKEESQVTGPSN